MLAQSNHKLYSKILIGISALLLMGAERNPFNMYSNSSYFKYHVKKCVSKAKTDGYLEYIIPELYKNKLPYELAYLPIIESCFEPTAVSIKGAKGLWQINDLTAKHLGMETRILIDERYDWRKSTHAAINYLKFLKARFPSWIQVLAAYNVGPTYIRGQMREKNSDKLGDLKLPRETVKYINQFVAMIDILQNINRNKI